MAAEELNMEKLEKLKRQVESLGLNEKQRNKLITDEERRPEREPDIEREIREKRLARRNFGRAIVFVFFAINYCGFCWRGELLNSYWWTHFAVFLKCVVK